MYSKKPLSFEKGHYTMKQLASKSDIKFPAVVWLYTRQASDSRKTPDDSRKTSDDSRQTSDDLTLKNGSLVLLERQIIAQYVRVRVPGSIPATEEGKNKGTEIDKNYNTFEEKEIFLPLEYPGKLTPLNRSFRRESYWQIAQIIDDLPRYIRLEADLIFESPTHGGANRQLSKGTRLEIKRIIEVDCTKRIECVDAEGSSYHLKEKLMIHFSALPNKKTQTLMVFMNSNRLPKMVQFEPVVNENGSLQNKLSKILAGPVRLIETLTKRVTVAWSKNELSSDCVNVLLIPDSNKSARAQLLSFKTKKDTASFTTSFTDEKFEGCNCSSFLESNRYFIKGSDIVVITPFEKSVQQGVLPTLPIDPLYTTDVVSPLNKPKSKMQLETVHGHLSSKNNVIDVSKNPIKGKKNVQQHTQETYMQIPQTSLADIDFAMKIGENEPDSEKKYLAHEHLPSQNNVSVVSKNPIKGKKNVQQDTQLTPQNLLADINFNQLNVDESESDSSNDETGDYIPPDCARFA